MSALSIEKLPVHVGSYDSIYDKLIDSYYFSRHFVQQATSEKKRGSAAARRPRNLTSAGGPEYTSDRRIRTTR
jgi:hypothetical protein